MVRTEVKIGAAVFAVLIAVIIVYALVVPAPKQNQPVVSADDEFKRQMIEAEKTLNAPVAVKTETPAPSSNTPPIFKSETPAAADPFADSGERWLMALNTGTVPSKVTNDRVSPGNSALPSVSPAGTISNSRSPSLPPLAVSGSSNGLNTKRSAAEAAAPADGTHVVLAGESIARIAESVYGSQQYYKVILQANPGVDPKRLKPGMTLKIPPVASVTGQSKPVDPALPVAVDAKREYRIVSGDSLQRIATKLYGKPDRWQEIYELNRAKIGDDPARIKVGMILKLPAAPSQAN